MRPLSLYLHIPFCVRKCEYCDFASEGGKQALIPSYVEALIGEIREAGCRWGGREVRTVFFGGGTPSLLTGEQFARLMDELRRTFPFAADAEISLESNPGTLTAQNLAAYREAGANRLSIGVQALDDRLLRSIGRIHTRDEASQAAQLARDAGFLNFNLDLMYGLPGQSVMDFRETLRLALETRAPHLSLYSLIVEEGTPIAARVEAGEELPGEEEVLEMQHEAARMLSGQGVYRYEISNYARPGFECRHNLVYWERGEYLGLGCAAHSLMEETRFENTACLAAYLAGERAGEAQKLTGADALEEMVMLSLRTRWGLPLQEYRRLMGDAAARKQPVIERMLKDGLATEENDRFILTERGMDVLNAAIEALL